jgi:hypothetical protein
MPTPRPATGRRLLPNVVLGGSRLRAPWEGRVIAYGSVGDEGDEGAAGGEGGQG